MLSVNPAGRPTCESILSHSYFYEQPAPCDMAQLPQLEGDWHEYESKREKKRPARDVIKVEDVKDVGRPERGRAAVKDERRSARARSYSSDYSSRSSYDSSSSLRSRERSRRHRRRRSYSRGRSRYSRYRSSSRSLSRSHAPRKRRGMNQLDPM